MDCCCPPGSSVHGIPQARILKWVAMPSSRGSSQPRDRTQVSCIAGKFFTFWTIREAQEIQAWLYGGPCCSRGVRTDSRFPCLLHEVGQLHSLQGLRVGVCPGVRLEERLRLLAQPFGGILCRGHVQYPALAPDTLFLLQALQKGQLVFLFFLYHVIRNFPQ